MKTREKEKKAETGEIEIGRPGVRGRRGSIRKVRGEEGGGGDVAGVVIVVWVS